MGRKLLSTGDKITLKNFRNGELLELEITSTPLGEGGSCVVYEAREAGSGLVCKYRLKELYPENIDGIDRDKNNQLIIGNNIRPEYHEACTRFDKSLKLLWDMAYSNDTGSYTVCPLGKFIGMAADTPAQYLITQWMPSDSLNTANLCGSDDLYLIAKICLKTAMAVKEFHKKGYMNVTVELPKDKMVVVTGLSGSGKSSLAFDTIYAEGQRRYVESMSAYARQFLELMAVYSQMGIDWDSALMASLIYRVVYYILPGIVSIFIYWGLQLSSPSSPRKNKKSKGALL